MPFPAPGSGLDMLIKLKKRNSQRAKEAKPSDSPEDKSSSGRDRNSTMNTTANTDYPSNRGKDAPASKVSNSQTKTQKSKPSTVKDSQPVANPYPESSQTAGVKGAAGAQSGPSKAAETTTSPSTPPSPVDTGKNILEYPSLKGKDEPTTTYGGADRKGLFGESISAEKWDAMTAKNKESGFWSKFADGGVVGKVKGGPKSVDGGPKHCDAMRFHK